MMELEMKSGKDLENLPKPTRFEIAESNYRRGYRDGMMIFLRDIEAFFKLTKAQMKNYDLAFDFTLDTLNDWQNERDDIAIGAPDMYIYAKEYKKKARIL